MIARDLIVFLLLVILPFLYIEVRSTRKNRSW